MSYFANSFPQFPLPFASNDFGALSEWNEIGPLPSEEECFKLWDKYEMLDNIKEHSLLVAQFSRALAILIDEKFPHAVNVEAAYVGGLLHDIAKTWTIKHEGSHQMLGASIVRAETKNPYLAACVYHHVVWPWEEGELALEKVIFHVPVLIAYSDKRIRHNEQVTLKERFDDLLDRYGKTEVIREHINVNYNQAKKMEDFLSKKLEIDLNACTLDSGLLVARA